jgi:hypothetical protein
LHRIRALRSCSCRDLYFSEKKYQKGGKSIAAYIIRRKESDQFYGEISPENQTTALPKEPARPTARGALQTTKKNNCTIANLKKIPPLICFYC